LDKAKKDLAEAYETMMGLAAWKHFEANILNRIEDQASKDEDNVPLDELSVAKIAECRGRRKAIDKIHTDLDYIVHGLK
jgi:hypothetical protein